MLASWRRPPFSKAALELTNLDYIGAQRSIQKAIDFDYQWSSPHNQVGVLLLKRAQWNAAEKEFMEAQRFAEKEEDTAKVLNNLAQLLQATNRLSEAEPLMRRALLILLKFTRETGHTHPHLRAALQNYSDFLKEMSLGDEEIRKRLVQVGKDAGFDLQNYLKLLGQPL